MEVMDFTITAAEANVQTFSAAYFDIKLYSFPTLDQTLQQVQV